MTTCPSRVGNAGLQRTRSTGVLGEPLENGKQATTDRQGKAEAALLVVVRRRTRPSPHSVPVSTIARVRVAWWGEEGVRVDVCLRAAGGGVRVGKLEFGASEIEQGTGT